MLKTPIGYTEIVKIAEAGKKGNSTKAKSFMKQYVEKYPEGDFTSAFKAILADITDPSGFREHFVIEQPEQLLTEMQ